SFKLKYDHKESSKVANLSINKFYSTKQFDALCNSLTIDDLKINVDSDLSPSEYNVDNIQLKKDSPLLSINANLIISQTELVLADDQNGNLDIKVILADKINKCTYSKNLKIAGFYSILKHKKQVEEFANSLSRYSFLPTRRKLHRLSNYDTNLIRFNEKDNDTFKEITKKVDFKYIWEPNVNGDEEIAFIRFIFTAKNKKFSVEKVVGPYGGFYKTGDIYTIDYEYLCKFCWYMMMSAESSNAKDPDLIRYHNYYWLFNNGKISKEEIERRLNCLIRDQNAIWRINKIYYDNPKNDEEKKHKEDGEKLIQKIDSCPHLRAKIIWWSDNSDYENYVCFGFQLVNSIEGKPDYDYDEKTPIIKIWAKKDHAFGTVKQSKDQL
uniref:lipoprotein 17-related variable surface protein n=1 Tax=Mycoplasmopsis primatum TaxID=55604 RepID=UPI00056B9DCB